MAYSKSLNPVTGTGSQTISALKEQVHLARYGSLSHTHTDSITTDNSGDISTTFEIPSGAATSVNMDFSTGTNYSAVSGLTISITANGLGHSDLHVSSITDITDIVMTANNGVIMIYRVDWGHAVNIELAKSILDDFTGFGDIQVNVHLSYNPEGAGQVLSMTANYN